MPEAVCGKCLFLKLSLRDIYNNRFKLNFSSRTPHKHKIVLAPQGTLNARSREGIVLTMVFKCSYDIIGLHSIVFMRITMLKILAIYKQHICPLPFLIL
jgi:hypothetical protein